MLALRRFGPLVAVLALATSGLLTALGNAEAANALMALGGLLGDPSNGQLVTSVTAIAGVAFKAYKLAFPAKVS
jgi:hypothetical protein